MIVDRYVIPFPGSQIVRTDRNITVGTGITGTGNFTIQRIPEGQESVPEGAFIAPGLQIYLDHIPGGLESEPAVEIRPVVPCRSFQTIRCGILCCICSIDRTPLFNIRNHNRTFFKIVIHSVIDTQSEGSPVAS